MSGVVANTNEDLLPLPPVKARTYDTDPKAATRATVVQMSRVFFIMLLVAMCVGVTMSWVFYFRSYDGQFARLRAEDLNISQGIYNETIARIAKDMILMTKQASMQALLDADIAARKAEQGYVFFLGQGFISSRGCFFLSFDRFVNETLLNDTAARIRGFAAISEGLQDEIAGRQFNDTILQQDIDNATATITQIVTFNNYSLAEFMVLMSNITDISSEIIAETATRTAQQSALLTQQIILANSLSILVSQLNNEINTRIAQDQSIQQMLEDATFNLIYTVNGLPPLNGTIVLRSLNPVFVTVTNGPAVNEVRKAHARLFFFNEFFFLFAGFCDQQWHPDVQQHCPRWRGKLPNHCGPGHCAVLPSGEFDPNQCDCRFHRRDQQIRHVGRLSVRPGNLLDQQWRQRGW